MSQQHPQLRTDWGLDWQFAAIEAQSVPRWVVHVTYTAGRDGMAVVRAATAQAAGDVALLQPGVRAVRFVEPHPQKSRPAPGPTQAQLNLEGD